MTEIEKKQYYVEQTFLSILAFHCNEVYDLIQIKSKYLYFPENMDIMDSIIATYIERGIVDYNDVFLKFKIATIDYWSELITEDVIPLVDYRKQFMICQSIILDNYKKKVIKDISEKFNNGFMTTDEYLRKMSVIQEIVIKTDTDVISEQELLNNISTKEKGIELKNFRQLNKILKLVQGDFLMIGASTGVGKSGLLLNLMNDLMEDYQCIYFNMEMSKSTIYKRIISIHSNVPIENIEHPVSEYQSESVKNAIKDIVNNKIVIEHKATYLEEIKNVLKMLKNDKKHTIIFLDHIGLIRTKSNRSQYEQITEIAKQLRQICLDYDCTIISACQLNRTSYNSEQLNLSMLKDSGELENSSSKVILLYRDKSDKERNEKTSTPIMILDIVKNRDGLLEKIKCKYDKTKQIFTEIEEWKQGN